MIKYHAQFLLDRLKDSDIAKCRYRIKWDGNIVAFSLGYKIEPNKWSLETQRCKNNTTHGKKKISANVINRRIQEYQNACEEIFAEHNLNKTIPSKEEFRDLFNQKIGRSAKSQNKSSNFFEVFDLFIEEESTKNQWQLETFTKFRTIRKHLSNFDINLSFETLNEDRLVQYQLFLQDTLSYRNSTLLKHISFVKWFLRWAFKRGYNANNAFETFTPKVKTTKAPVIFLNAEEINKVKALLIPKNREALEKVRDIFLFQCFTGLRYSDVTQLRVGDIKDGQIVLTTIKTYDSLNIDLNNHSKDIIKKYSEGKDKTAKVLPTISNQKMNDYLKELMELAGIDEPIRLVYFKGNKRIEKVVPKYALITTHVGRKTFICTALALGIPPQVVMKWTGHSNYESMKPYIDVADTIKASAMEKFNSI